MTNMIGGISRVEQRDENDDEWNVTEPINMGFIQFVGIRKGLCFSSFNESYWLITSHVFIELS